MQERLYRNKKDKMIAGVCSGLGSYFDIDPVVVRLVFIIATFISGVGLIAYLILWVAVPEKQDVIVTSYNAGVSDAGTINFSDVNSTEPNLNNTESVRVDTKRTNRATIFGIILIVFGAILLLDKMLPYFLSDKLWPLLLIALGVFLLMKSKNKQVNL